MREWGCHGRLSEMRLTYKLTAGEYVSAQRLHLGRGFPGFVRIAFFYVFLPILGFLLILCLPWARDGVTISTMTWLPAPLIVLFTPVWLSLYSRYRFRASRVTNSPCNIDFEEGQIFSEMPGYSKSTIEWAAIKNYREGAKVLLIYVSRTSFFVVPRRACEKEEFSELIALLDRKLALNKA